MSEKKLTFEEFSEEYMDENRDICYCHATTMPPCAFCEGSFLEEAYEDYLEEFEEENK